jgi:hypothetical protein
MVLIVTRNALVIYEFEIVVYRVDGKLLFTI